MRKPGQINGRNVYRCSCGRVSYQRYRLCAHKSGSRCKSGVWACSPGAGHGRLLKQLREVFEDD